MTHKKLKPGKVSETEFGIEFFSNGGWHDHQYADSLEDLATLLANKKKSHPSCTFRAVQIVKTPMEEVDL